jgi:hypothetical protein
MIHATKTWEFRISLIISIVATIMFFTLVKQFYPSCYSKVIYNLGNNAPTIVTVSVTLSGFFLTALSIMTVFKDSQKIKMVKTGGHYEDIPGFLLLTTISFFLLFTTSLLYLLIGIKEIIELLLFFLFMSITTSVIAFIIIGYAIDSASS